MTKIVPIIVAQKLDALFEFWCQESGTLARYIIANKNAAFKALTSKLKRSGTSNIFPGILGRSSVLYESIRIERSQVQSAMNYFIVALNTAHFRIRTM